MIKSVLSLCTLTQLQCDPLRNGVAVKFQMERILGNLRMEY